MKEPNKPEWNETCSQAPANKEFSTETPRRSIDISHVPADVRRRIVDLHQTYGVNHVIFLLDYKYNADVINQVLREEIYRLKSECEGRKL